MTSYRFKGVEPEPRPSIPSGHMPHSVSVPFSKLLTTNSFNGDTYTTLLPPSELRSALVRSFSASGASNTAEGERILQRILGGEKQAVVSCGSGMTAAIIWLALQELGAKGKVALYDEVRSVSDDQVATTRLTTSIVPSRGPVTLAAPKVLSCVKVTTSECDWTPKCRWNAHGADKRPYRDIYYASGETSQGLVPLYGRSWVIKELSV